VGARLDLQTGALERFNRQATPSLDRKNNVVFHTDPDVFDYVALLGVLGKLADRLFLERYMRRLLEERNAVIKRMAEE
jgi:hypothetical protein